MCCRLNHEQRLMRFHPSHIHDDDENSPESASTNMDPSHSGRDTHSTRVSRSEDLAFMNGIIVVAVKK